MLIQVKVLRMGPHVRTVMRDVDREVAHHADAFVFLFAIALQRLPLFEEGELQELLLADLIGQFGLRSFQRSRFAGTQFPSPFGPCNSTEPVFQRTEERVILQPATLSLFEPFKFALVTLGACRLKFLKSAA